MSTQAIGSNSGAPTLNITGLASGLDTNSIISALLSLERQPITQLTNHQTFLSAQEQQMRTMQGSLQQLSFAATDLGSPSLFNSSQAVGSSNSNQITATATTGAGVGGYQVAVTQLANSAQRTFTFASPAAADTITIDGHETKIAAGASIKDLVNAVNSDSNATVYAAALDSETVVFSNRTTGDTGAGFIALSDPGAALTEKAGTAKQGRNAEYSVDGVAATSTSNIVSNAIAGVTLSLQALTTTGPVTINVAAPAPNTTAIVEQVQSFVKLYNSTVSEIQKQLTTKPPTNPKTAEDFSTGTLFGDSDLAGLIGKMRQSVYTPVTGLPVEMASLANIGISTGAAQASGVVSQSSVQGQLTLNASQLEEAVKTNPAGVKKMLQSWASGFRTIVGAQAEGGGMLDTRITSDETQSSDIAKQITSLNEMLALREQALRAQYAQLEAVMSQNQSQSAWLTSQTTAMLANSVVSSSSH